MSDILLKNEKDERRDKFIAAALTGLCATDLSAVAIMQGDPGKVGVVALQIADATIDLMKRIDDNTPDGVIT